MLKVVCAFKVNVRMGISHGRNRVWPHGAGASINYSPEGLNTQ